MRAALALLLLAGGPAFAQYDGPAVEACRAYAKKELEREGTRAAEVVFERDRALSIERYKRKVGSQFVSSILTGHGAVVLEGAPSAELSFICLLAGEKRPVFFDWLPRADAPALAQCRRSREVRAQAHACLEQLLFMAEQDLFGIYNLRFQEANERGPEKLAAYRKSNEQWRQYRDAECARRRDLAPAGVEADDARLACFVELTRRRALDMR